VTGGSTADTITAYGSGESVTGGSGTENITILGSFSSVTAGGGNDTINLTGYGDTVTSGAFSGSNQDVISVAGSSFFTLDDGPNTYADTVTGFSQAAGDTIHLTGSDTSSYAVAHSAPANGGQDTQITLNDGSTILLKGVTSIDPSFFS